MSEHKKCPFCGQDGEVRGGDYPPQGGGVMSTKPIGMYGETPRVTIGEYSICRQDDTSVWIEHESGEGAQFSDESFEECIKDFYNKHF